MTHHRVGLSRWPAHPYTRAQQLFPQLETTPDISRGEQRLAAEVALAELAGRTVSERAHHRAHVILKVMASA